MGEDSRQMFVPMLRFWYVACATSAWCTAWRWCCSEGRLLPLFRAVSQLHASVSHLVAEERAALGTKPTRLRAWHGRPGVGLPQPCARMRARPRSASHPGLAGH